ncbi:hypothetical protein [Methylomonas sp. MgM2]
MNMRKLIDQVSKLPLHKQEEVIDFVEFIYRREMQSETLQSAVQQLNDWTDQTFKEFSLVQAMRGVEDESTLYTEADLKERW